MRILSDHLRRRIEAEETRRVLDELQIAEQAAHPFLEAPESALRRYRVWLERSGEILAGATIGALALLIYYFVFVRLLHVTF